MKIGIYGCGAMGTVMGALLTKNGCPVELIDNYKDHVDAMNEKGAHIVGFMDEFIPVKAFLPEQIEGIYDVLFIFTKQTANNAILPNIKKHIDEKTTICTLQNGVPEPFWAENLGADRVCGGTVLWGATFWSPGVSELTQDLSKTDHTFEIGQFNGEIGPHIERVKAILEQMGRPVHVTTQLMQSRWSKLINNACMSGMSAVGGCTFGEVLDDPKAIKCLVYIGHEVKACANAEGYSIPPMFGVYNMDCLDLKDEAQFDEGIAAFLGVYDGLRTAKASMLQDLEKDRKCEVSMINGYVCQIGDKHGIDTPFCDKAVEIITKIENHELKLTKDNFALFTDDMFYLK
ncbi:MAG: 2-dehydropantoate 2-reductase [Lachnospiraceae bacterium]|nr:2-dehydropantoate 2-reductase [Lachnospiraceae bacterium]